MAPFTDPAVTVPTTVEECDAQLDDLRMVLAGNLTPKRRRFVWRVVNRVIDIRNELADPTERRSAVESDIAGPAS